MFGRYLWYSRISAMSFLVNDIWLFYYTNSYDRARRHLNLLRKSIAPNMTSKFSIYYSYGKHLKYLPFRDYRIHLSPEITYNSKTLKICKTQAEPIFRGPDRLPGVRILNPFLPFLANRPRQNEIVILQVPHRTSASGATL